MKNKIFTIVMAALILLGSVSFCLCPDKDFSEMERRLLQQAPALSLKNLLAGSFMDEFEAYAQDQFPLRDSLRGLKTAFSLGTMKHGDNNGLYIFRRREIAKIDSPLSEKMLDYAAGRIDNIHSRYLEGTDCRVYFSMIPDKNYFLGPMAKRPYLDFKQLESYMLEKTDNMEYIPITQYLSVNDYYSSDSHWRQENLGPVAEAICAAMGTEVLPYTDHDQKFISEPFRGVYAGQLGIDHISDRLNYIETNTIRACTVTSYDSGKAESVPFYDMEAAHGRDPYEMFLNGADALLVIENPIAQSGRELVIFRDSFGSSLAPLLIESYDKITLVDLRYIHSSMLGQYIDFSNQDVLFICSSGLMNNSLALK